jgi:assimilatory nitrate reductase catalytic subunit
VFKRAKWQDNTLSGFLFAGDISGGEALLSDLMEEKHWEGSRLKVFSSNAGITTRDKVICSCKLIKESQITRMASTGANLSEIKNKLGCGTVCGSCLQEVKRICNAALNALESASEVNN